MKTRQKGCTGCYRFGFNGKEKDHSGEWGTQTHYDYGFRIYNPAIGKFLSVDPLTKSYPYFTPYQFTGNNPIRYIDLDGLEKAEPEAFQAASAMLDKEEDEIKNDPSRDATVVDGYTMTEAIGELRSQLNDPNSSQTNYLGYYCGKSACQNVQLNYNPIAYTTMTLGLLRSGETRFGGNGPKLSVPSTLRKNGLSGSVPGVDEVFGKSLNESTTNKSIVRKLIGSKLNDEGNTIPFEMRRIQRTLGLKTSGTFYIGQSKSHLRKMVRSLKKGYLPIVFENHGVTRARPDLGQRGTFGIHYITIHKMSIKGDQVEFDYFEYGDVKKGKKSVKEFLNGTKGIWIPKNK